MISNKKSFFLSLSKKKKKHSTRDSCAVTTDRVLSTPKYKYRVD